LLLRHPDDFPKQSDKMDKPTPENHRGYPLPVFSFLLSALKEDQPPPVGRRLTRKRNPEDEV